MDEDVYYDVRTESRISFEKTLNVKPDASGDFGSFGSAKWHAHAPKDAPLPANEVPQTLLGVLGYRGQRALEKTPISDLLRDAKNAPDKPRAQRDYAYALLDKLAAITELLREIPYRIPGQYSGFGATDEGLPYTQRQIDAPRSQVTLDLLRVVPSSRYSVAKRLARDPETAGDPYRDYVQTLTLAQLMGFLAYINAALPKIRKIVDVTDEQANAVTAFTSDIYYQATQGRELAPRFSVKEGRVAQGRNMYGQLVPWPAVQTDPKFGERNPVKNWGIHIASGVWVCCGERVASGHPGCLIDKHNVRDNQSRPARFTLSRKENPAITGAQWLASYRRGTAYLDELRYEDMHQRIKDAISAINTTLLNTAFATLSVEAFFFVLGVKEVSRLIFMFRLIHQYNEYRQDEQEPAPVSSMEWARYIARHVYGQPLSLDISGPLDERKVPGFDPRVMKAILDYRRPGPVPGGGGGPGGGGPPPPDPGAPGGGGGGGPPPPDTGPKGGAGGGPPADTSGPKPAYNPAERNAIKGAPATVAALLKNLEDVRELIFEIPDSKAPTRRSALTAFSGYILAVNDLLARVTATEVGISTTSALTAELVSAAAADTTDALKEAQKIREEAQERYDEQRRLLADEPYQQFLLAANSRRDQIKTAIDKVIQDADAVAAADPALQGTVDATKDELFVVESKVADELRSLGPLLFADAAGLDSRLLNLLALVESYRIRIANLSKGATGGGGGAAATASLGGGATASSGATTATATAATGSAGAGGGGNDNNAPAVVKVEPVTPPKPTRPVSGTPGSGKKLVLRSEPLPGYPDRRGDEEMIKDGILSDYGRRRLERARSLFLQLDSLEEISVPTSKYEDIGVPDNTYIMWSIPDVKGAKKTSVPPSPTEFAYLTVRDQGILPLLEAIFGPGSGKRSFAYPPTAGKQLSFSDAQLEFLFGNPATAKKQIDRNSLAYKVMFLRQFEDAVNGKNFPSVLVSEWAPTSERTRINSKGYLAETGANFDRKLFFVSTAANLRSKVGFIGRAWAAFIRVFIQITSESGAKAATLAELQAFVATDERASAAIAAIDNVLDPKFGFVNLYNNDDDASFDLEKMKKVASRVQDPIEIDLIEAEENFLYGGPPVRHPEQDVLEQFAAIGAGSSESTALFRGVGRRGQTIEIGALASRMLNFEKNQIYADFNDKGQTTEIRIENLRSFILSRFLALLPTYATRMRILPDRLKRLRLMDAEGEFLDFVTDVRTGPSDLYIGDLTVQQQIDLIHQWGQLAQEMALFKKKIDDEEKAKLAKTVTPVVIAESAEKGWFGDLAWP